MRERARERGNIKTRERSEHLKPLHPIKQENNEL
jgi:hypothetical protein